MRIGWIVLACLLSACSPPGSKDPEQKQQRGPKTPCEKHLSVIEGEDDPHQRHVLEAAWAYFESAPGTECPYELRWKVIERAVSSLDDTRELRPNFFVNNAARRVLEMQTGTTQPDWRAWWKDKRDERDEVLSASKTARVAQLEKRVRGGVMHVDHVWRIRAWKNEKLEPQFLVDSVVPVSFDAPMLPVVREQVQWGFYLRKDGVIHHVQRVSKPDSTWYMDAKPVNTTTTIERAIPPGPDLFVWPYSKELPLEGIKNNDDLKPIPTALLDGIKASAPHEWDKLVEKSVLTVNVVDGDVVARIQIRAP
jgi:hypothetical protein